MTPIIVRKAAGGKLQDCFGGPRWNSELTLLTNSAQSFSFCDKFSSKI